MTSTTKRGDSFRDIIVSMLEAAGFRAASEVLVEFKKTDAVWQRDDIDGTVVYLVETKDYKGALPRDECAEFVSEYGQLVRNGKADRAWLISRGEIVASGRAHVDAERGCKAMTFAEFQRRLLGIDSYLRDLLAKFENDRIETWYVPPHTEEGVDLESRVREWIGRRGALPLAVVSAYGRGKSTFARFLAAKLALQALDDQSQRVPVLVPLGDIVDEQSLEGLLGKIFTSGPGQRYNFGLFDRLNQAGRFVVIFDGFDEMKHGMTLPRFEGNIVELMRLDRGDAKLIILGRDTALHDDVEFRSIIMGRQQTAGGSEVTTSGRRAFEPVSLRDFTLEEARLFVRRFFPLAAAEAHRGLANPPDDAWVNGRISELLDGRFDQLLLRPVHAQMLCQIATDPTLILADLSTHGLFDRFVHFLIEREIRKRGRDPRFTLDARRRFNGSLALWLWRQGGVSTVSLAAVPIGICHDAARDVAHGFDDVALRKELTAGCLVEKGAGTIFFGHRSLQEFLVAETLLLEQDRSNISDIVGLINPEIATFIVDAARSNTGKARRTAEWFAALEGFRKTDVAPAAIRMFVDLLSSKTIRGAPADRDPWYLWLNYFVTNGGVTYAPRTGDALRMLPQLIGQTRSPEAQAAAVILAAHAFREDFPDRRTAGATWLGVIMRPEALREAVLRAQKCRGNELSYVTRPKDPALWALLQAIKIERLDESAVIEVDLELLAVKLVAFARIGIADDANRAASGQIVRTLEIPLQVLYKVWNLRDSELDKIRPFFNDFSVRRRIRPLDVEIRPVRSDRGNAVSDERPPTSESREKGSRSKPMLSLKRPVGRPPAR